MRNYIMIGVLALVAAAFAAPTLAGNGKGGGGSAPPTSGNSITLNGTAAYGGTASFTVVDPPVSGQPEMSLTCSKNGQDVYLGVQMMSGASPYTPTFTLSSPTWAASGGGSASCHASLFYYTWQGKQETGVVYMAAADFVTQ